MKVIADIGMHDGKDTDFYLAKGFRVVAVEANPELVERNQRRFSGSMRKGHLQIVHAALGDSDRPVSFWVNDRKSDWSSVHRNIAARDGGEVRRFEVPGMRASDFFNRYQDIHYAKIDVEGSDGDVLVGMMNSACRPLYISTEAGGVWLLGVMKAMGYGQFKMVSQAFSFLHRGWRMPNPALHGNHVDYTFQPGSSGPFGEEAPGEWKSMDEIADAHLSMRRVKRILPGQTNNWWDFHAKRTAAGAVPAAPASDSGRAPSGREGAPARSAGAMENFRPMARIRRAWAKVARLAALRVR